MSTQNNFSRSFEPAVAISRGRVVSVIASGKVALAPVAATNAIGVVQEDVGTGAWENASVRLFGTGTAMISVTGVPVTAGDVMFLCTNGQVSATDGIVGASGVRIGVLLENVATNGLLAEVAMQGVRVS